MVVSTVTVSSNMTMLLEDPSMPAKEDLDKWWPEPVLETRSPLFELPAIGGTRDKPVDGTYLTSVSPPRTGAASRAPSRHPERRERVVAVGGLWRNASDDPCRTNTAASRTTTAAATTGVARTTAAAASPAGVARTTATTAGTAVRTTTASASPPREVEPRIRTAFERFDKDKSGGLDTRELGRSSEVG